jgi:uncharacterized repeat protein (TIGR03803 family)
VLFFSFDPSTSTYTKLNDFDGTNGADPHWQPYAGKRWKAIWHDAGEERKQRCGVIFSFDPSSSTYTKLHDFDGANGASPVGSLMEARDGKLYGMTNGGGSGRGVIFSFDPSTSTYKKLHDFDRTNGVNPVGSLMEARDGKLYGMTRNGGSNGYDDQESNGYGVIFSFDPSTSTYTKLHDFDGANGASPTGSLLQASNGKLYAVTQGGERGSSEGGGSSGAGVIFSFDPSTSTYTRLKDFAINETGSYVSASLIQASDGKLYGMTTYGGSGYGVIFSFDPSTSTYTKLKDFDGTNGGNPSGSLIQATNGKLYGMTSAGGRYGNDDYNNGYGVIFSFDPSTSIYTKLHDFNTTDGANPQGSLIEARDGKLYGMTLQRGSNNRGVIFSFDPSSSTYTKLHYFDGANGGSPYGSLMQARDGKLYGMTSGGGSGYGVIFSFDPSSYTYTKLKDFDGKNGFVPRGSLIEASNGKLYGMTYYGGSGYDDETYEIGYGVIFSFDPTSSTYTKLKDFGGTNGAFPQGSLMQASDGKLYGMTERRGSSNVGVIFSFDPATSTYTKLKDYNGANGANPGIGSAFIEVKDDQNDLLNHSKSL